jgi:hypothetical protein
MDDEEKRDKNKEKAKRKKKGFASLRNNLFLYLAISTLITRRSLDSSFAKGTTAGVTLHLIAEQLSSPADLRSAFFPV